MGFRLESYNDNFCGLIVDYSYTTDSDYFYNGDSIEDALEYFDLYVDDKTARIKRNDPNQKVVDKLAINLSNVEEFQTMLENITNSFTDEQALTYILLIPDWSPIKHYNVGDRVRQEGRLYKCITSHGSQMDWSPDVSPSLWTLVLIDPDISEVQEWQQPESTNGYSRGDRVIYNGIIYESVIDNNTWEPGIVGTESLWEVIE